MDVEKIQVADEGIKAPAEIFRETVDKILKYSTVILQEKPKIEEENDGDFTLSGVGMVDLNTIEVVDEEKKDLPSKEEMSSDFLVLTKSVEKLFESDAAPSSYWPEVIKVLEKFLASSAAPSVPIERLATVRPLLDVMKNHESSLTENEYMDEGVMIWIGNFDKKLHERLLEEEKIEK